MMTASDQIDMMKRTNDDALGQPAHVVPEVDGAEADRRLVLEEAESCRVKCDVSEVSENH